MPSSATSIRTLTRASAQALVLAPGESAEDAMDRVDRLETEAVVRHLLGDALVDRRRGEEVA